MHERGQLDCGHRFCFDCIRDWSKVTNLCPLCKRAFLKITKTTVGTDKSETIQVESKAVDLDELLQEPVLENGSPLVTVAEDHCYACEEEEDEDQMLVCDHCLTKCCHIFCLSPPLDHIPYEPWYCDFCIREHNLRTTLPQANFFGTRRRRRAPLLEDDDDDEGSIPGLVNQAPASLQANSRQQSGRQPSRAEPPRRDIGRGRGANNQRNQSTERSQDDEDDAWLAEASNSRTVRAPLRNRGSSRASSDSEPQAAAGMTYRRNPDHINNRQALQDFRDQRRQSRQERAQPLSRQASGQAQNSSEPLGFERFPHTVAVRTFSRATHRLQFDDDAFEDEFS